MPRGTGGHPFANGDDDDGYDDGYTAVPEDYEEKPKVKPKNQGSGGGKNNPRNPPRTNQRPVRAGKSGRPRIVVLQAAAPQDTAEPVPDEYDDDSDAELGALLDPEEDFEDAEDIGGALMRRKKPDCLTCQFGPPIAIGAVVGAGLAYATGYAEWTRGALYGGGAGALYGLWSGSSSPRRRGR